MLRWSQLWPSLSALRRGATRSQRPARHKAAQENLRFRPVPAVGPAAMEHRARPEGGFQRRPSSRAVDPVSAAAAFMSRARPHPCNTGSSIFATAMSRRASRCARGPKTASELPVRGRVDHCRAQRSAMRSLLLLSREEHDLRHYLLAVLFFCRQRCITSRLHSLQTVFDHGDA